jgi:hypothetical protein
MERARTDRALAANPSVFIETSSIFAYFAIIENQIQVYGGPYPAFRRED